MNLRAGFVLAASVALAASAPASVAAQTPAVRVDFSGGRVSVAADNATVLEILREWSRVGGSTFVRAEQIPSTERLTLRLENVTETRALEVLLRSAAGYAAAPRKTPGLSSIGIVLIIPTATQGTTSLGPAGMQPIPDMPESFTPMTRPDADGPVQRQTPPPYNPQNALAPPPVVSSQPNAPATGNAIGQASPLAGTTTQTLPGGAVTSSQPGVIIPNTRPGGKPAPPTPTQLPTRPGGGG